MNARPTETEIGTRWGERGTAGATIPASLSFERITHRYGSLTAVNDLSLAVRSGEIMALLGQSGCGKTTLLRIAAGIERQSHGRVLSDGRVMAGDATFIPPEKRGIGLMFQDYALFPHLRIIDNVSFGLKALSRTDARKIAHATLERVGMDRYADSYPHMLSGGEQQRVALARAIAPRPGVLLMDEPFSGLDKRLRDDVREETLAILRETHATCLLVTHDPEEAMRMADRIALMRGGSLIQEGPPEELYSSPRDLFVARFFSELNELPGQIKEGRLATALGTFEAGGLADGPAIAAIRPSAIRIAAPGEGTPGLVLSRRFVGDADLLRIAIGSSDIILHARINPGTGVSPGRELGVAVDRAGLLVFPAARP